MKQVLKKVVVLIFSIVILVQNSGISSFGEENQNPYISEFNSNNFDFSYNVINYFQYYETHRNYGRGRDEISIDISSYTADSQNVSLESSYEGKNNVLITNDNSNVTYEVLVEEDSIYNIEITYFPISGKGNPIEREIIINGERPFIEASNVVFQRSFVNESKPETDDKGNEYRPAQIERQLWMKETLKDNQGYYEDPFIFYFREGSNYITINSVSEPMAISSIKLITTEKIITYSELLGEYEKAGYKDVSDSIIEIQGESAIYKSDSTLYPINDRSSYATVPQSVTSMKLNTIGGVNWSNPRQKITWEFYVPESGLYIFNMRCKQNFSDFALTNRTVYIDGEIPFEEAKYLEVMYDGSWQYYTFGNEDPYKFYFSEGMHTITLENTLGYITETLRELQLSVNSLNSMVQKTRMIVGMFPDPNRDYTLETQIPEMMEVFATQSELLKSAAAQIQIRSGEKNSAIATIQKLYLQLDSFISDISTVPKRLASFETNISAVANYILVASRQPLTIDYLTLTGYDENKEPKRESFFRNVWYEILLFFNSFISDYGIINSSESQKSIELWVGSGRDQAMVLKSLTENTFSNKTGIAVNMRLVNNTVLLPAVAAGKGPDVALGQEKSVPVNYGIRNAIYELNNFPDLDEVLERFDESSYISYEFNGKMYGLPETQTFMMLFYRKDILNELGIDVPQTWEELYEILFLLHKNYFDIGLPNITEDTIELYLMFLYQEDGNFYNENLNSTLVYSEKGQQSFSKWVNLYTKYKITRKMDIFTRFRTGQAPLAIAPVTLYNQLVISAPEIKGLWDMQPILGTLKDNGEIDRSEVSGGTAAVIFRNTKDPKSSWEFLKWWTSEQAQVDYSKEMEILQGPSARVPTANLEAFSRLSWPGKTSKLINEQRKYVKGMPEVPGSYIVNRFLCTAARFSIETGGDPTEILFDYNIKINNEITKRRIEFNLD